MKQCAALLEAEVTTHINMGFLQSVPCSGINRFHFFIHFASSTHRCYNDFLNDFMKHFVGIFYILTFLIHQNTIQ